MAKSQELRGQLRRRSTTSMSSSGRRRNGSETHKRKSNSSAAYHGPLSNAWLPLVSSIWPIVLISVHMPKFNLSFMRTRIVGIVKFGCISKHASVNSRPGFIDGRSVHRRLTVLPLFRCSKYNFCGRPWSSFQLSFFRKEMSCFHRGRFIIPGKSFYREADICKANCKKSKVFLYWLPSVGPGADPGVQAVSPQVTISHSPGSRLPLLSARPVVTFPASEYRRPVTGTKLYCLVKEEH